jgi:hypothetical protein
VLGETFRVAFEIRGRQAWRSPCANCPTGSGRTTHRRLPPGERRCFEWRAQTGLGPTHEIQRLAVSFAVDGATVNLVDTPGNPDFIGAAGSSVARS